MKNTVQSKYQIETKANYINLILLEDELIKLDETLSRAIRDAYDWIEKLRATRAVFLTLYNISEVSNRLMIQGQPEYAKKTRELRKQLEFPNHARNKGIGHLDIDLLKRAAQWDPLMFVEAENQSREFRLATAQRIVIESCINSFINKEGVQKTFGHEIDLSYKNDIDEFYEYLKNLIAISLEWLSNSIKILPAEIDFHTKDDIFELASVASETDFNLKNKQILHYSKEESKIRISRGLDDLKKNGVPDDIIDNLKKKYGV